MTAAIVLGLIGFALGGWDGALIAFIGYWAFLFFLIFINHLLEAFDD